MAGTKEGVVPFYARNRSRSSSPFARRPRRVSNGNPRRVANLLFAGFLAFFLSILILPVLYHHSGWLFRTGIRTHHYKHGHNPPPHGPGTSDATPNPTLSDADEPPPAPDPEEHFVPFCNFVSDLHWLYQTPTLSGTNAQAFCDLGRVCLDISPRNKERVLGKGGYDSVTLARPCVAVVGEDEITDPSIVDCAAHRSRIMSTALGIRQGRIRHVKDAATVSEVISALDPVEIPGTSYFFAPLDASDAGGGCDATRAADFAQVWLPVFQAKLHDEELGIGGEVRAAVAAQEGFRADEEDVNRTNLVLDVRSADALNLQWQADLVKATMRRGTPTAMQVLTFDDVVANAGFKPVCFQDAVVFSRADCGGYAFVNETAVDDAVNASKLSVPRDAVVFKQELYEHHGVDAYAVARPLSGANATDPLPSLLEATSIKATAPRLRVGLFACAYIPQDEIVAVEEPANYTDRRESGLCFGNMPAVAKRLRIAVDKWRTIEMEVAYPQGTLSAQVQQMSRFGVVVMPHGSYLTMALFSPPGTAVVSVGPDAATSETTWRDVVSRNSGAFVLSATTIGGSHPSEGMMEQACNKTKTPCQAAKDNGEVTADLNDLEAKLDIALTHLRSLQPSVILHAAQTSIPRSTLLQESKRSGSPR